VSTAVTGYGPLVGRCSGCGTPAVLTMGLCGPCVLVVAPDASGLPQPPTSEPLPPPDPFYKRWVEALIRRMDARDARQRAQEGL